MADNREISSWEGFGTKDLAHFRGTPQEMIFSDVEIVHPPPADGSTSWKQQGSSFDISFDCWTVETVASPLEDGGIMGLADRKGAVWDDMYRSGAISHRAFSVCLGEGDGVGAVTFGGVDTRLQISSSPMVFAKKLQSYDGLFRVWVNEIYLQTQTKQRKRDGERDGDGDGDGEAERDSTTTGATTVRVDIEQEAINGQGVVLDSGRMHSYLTIESEGPFRAAWKQITGYDYHHDPIILSDIELHALPTIIFDFQVAHPLAPEGTIDWDDYLDVLSTTGSSTVTIAMPASHYMQSVGDHDEGLYQSQFYVGYDGGGGAVLGANFLRGHNVLFDIDNQRIGFAVSGCIPPPPPLSVELPGRDGDGEVEEEDARPRRPSRDHGRTVAHCTAYRCGLGTLTGLWFALTLALLSWNYGGECRLRGGVGGGRTGNGGCDGDGDRGEESALSEPHANRGTGYDDIRLLAIEMV